MNAFVQKSGFPEHPAADAGVASPAPQKQRGDAPATARPAQQEQSSNNWRQVGIHPTERTTDPYAFDVIG